MAPRTKRPDGERRAVLERDATGVWRPAGYLERAPDGGWLRVNEAGEPLPPGGPPAPLASGVSGIALTVRDAGSLVGDLLLGFALGELLADVLHRRRRRG